jgi:LPXTG-motif cell wall-anchored protein
LSAGAKAGIGVGLVVGILLLGIAFLLFRRKRKSTTSQEAPMAIQYGLVKPVELSGEHVKAGVASREILELEG